MKLFRLSTHYSLWHLPVKWTLKPARLSTASQDTRFNQVNVQLLPGYIRDHIFGPTTDLNEGTPSEVAEHLIKHGIDISQSPQVSASDVPKPQLVPLQGATIQEHFDSIAAQLLEPYKPLIDKLCECEIPQLPAEWEFAHGWTWYGENGPRQVPYPDEDALVLDVEICMQAGNDPVLATAVSPRGWYGWVSPRLVDERDTEWNPGDLIRWREHLIPTRGDKKNPRVVIGHNVSFDRARLREEYDIETSGTYFLDTKALHMCVNGATTIQRGKWLGTDFSQGSPEGDLELPGWMTAASPGALAHVYKLYTGEVLDKSEREIFMKDNLKEIRENFQTGISYCARDVMATLKVFQVLFPLFRLSCPSPVTQLGMMEMGSSFMPISTRDWSNFITGCEELHTEYAQKCSDSFTQLADDACHLLKDENYLLDPWLSTLDWSPSRSTKFKSMDELKLIKWYHKEFNLKRGYINPQKQMAPKLLRLVWEGNPLCHVKYLGWGYIIPATAENDTSRVYVEWMDYLEKFVAFLQADSNSKESLLRKVRSLYEKFNDHSAPYEKTFNLIERINTLKLQVPGIKIKRILSLVKKKAYTTNFGKAFGRIILPGFEMPFDFYPIPHKDGENSICGKPLGKEYADAMQEKKLKSAFTELGGEDILKIESSISFWRSNQGRIRNQMAVSDQNGICGYHDMSVILPNVCVAGTVTRRAVQNTWLTATNAESDRIGSELKTLITSPPGHVFVGADVDAQELWIAALLADSHFAGIHGCTAIGWMTLQGDKSNQTDLHSRTAQSLGITRNQAKILNYARIYGSGITHTTQLLYKFLPRETDGEVKKKAMKLHKETKGVRRYRTIDDDMYLYELSRGLINRSASNLYWSEGSESHLFNKLEEIANCREPRTPVLNCRISSALLPENVQRSFFTSRMNWVVQSSGVDYLHLLLVSMKWLMTTFRISGRYSLSIHDDIRFLVREEDAERAALALQLSNLYTRSLFAYMAGVPDLPLSVAFFSGVEIDRVIRKDPTNECVTLSNREGIHKERGIPPGRSLDINAILKANSCLGEFTP